MVMMAAAKAKELGVKPIARVVVSAPGSVEPYINNKGN
jgi:acetyl-CoA acetyltransferase